MESVVRPFNWIVSQNYAYSLCQFGAKIQSKRLITGQRGRWQGKCDLKWKLKWDCGLGLPFQGLGERRGGGTWTAAGPGLIAAKYVLLGRHKTSSFYLFYCLAFSLSFSWYISRPSSVASSSPSTSWVLVLGGSSVRCRTWHKKTKGGARTMTMGTHTHIHSHTQTCIGGICRCMYLTRNDQRSRRKQFPSPINK